VIGRFDRFIPAFLRVENCKLVPHESANFAVSSPGTRVPILAYFSNRCAATIAAVIRDETDNRGRVMLSWVVTFLVVALIAGILGFGGIAGVSIEIAKAIFFIAVILFVVSAVVGLARGRNRV
jgi:uncharacterized membrane protein YtjA (UPF0391 family)